MPCSRETKVESFRWIQSTLSYPNALGYVLEMKNSVFWNTMPCSHGRGVLTFQMISVSDGLAASIIQIVHNRHSHSLKCHILTLFWNLQLHIPSDSLSSFLNKIMYVFFASPIWPASITHLALFDLTILTIFGDQENYKTRSLWNNLFSKN